MRFLAATLGIASAASCVLPEFEPTGSQCPCADGFVCDAATNACVVALSGGGPGTGGTQAGGQAGQGGDPSGGGGGSTNPPLPGLQVAGDVGNGEISFFVDGSFKLVAGKSSNWQLTSWFDLANDAQALVDLGAALGDPLGRDVVYDPYWTMQSSWHSSEHGIDPTAMLEDQRPVRATLRTTIDYPNTPGARVTADYTVYASGRVGTRVTFAATDVSISLASSEIHHLTVAAAANWTGGVLANGHATSFLRADGPAPASNVLMVDLGEHGNPGSDSPDLNWYWDSGPQNLAANESLELTGELQFAPSGLDLAGLGMRAVDARDSSVSVISGSSGAQFLSGRAAIGMKVGSTPVAFVLDASVRRFAPAFELNEWSSPTFTIKLDDEVIASDVTPVTDRAIARFQPGDDSLVFIYAGDIEAGAEIGARTFSIEP